LTWQSQWLRWSFISPTMVIESTTSTTRTTTRIPNSVIVNDKGPVGKRMKDAMLSKGKPLILEKVRVQTLQSMAMLI